MFTETKIAPSILSADFMNMERDVKRIADGGCGYIHVDVMDGHFVPNITMGVPTVKQLKKVTDVPLDVHLMISNPTVQVPWFIEAGSDIITTHIEAFDSDEDVWALIRSIHAAGAKAGLSVKPKTPVEAIKQFIPELDLVLIMSVEPGFSGQGYIEGSEDKVAQVVAYAKEAGVSPLVEVDGGVSVKTAARLSEQGADVLVAGSAVCGAADPAQAIKDIIEVAEAARLAALS